MNDAEDLAYQQKKEDCLCETPPGPHMATFISTQLTKIVGKIEGLEAGMKKLLLRDCGVPRVGARVVNHDYSGKGSLAVLTKEGQGLPNVNIYAYLKSDFDNKVIGVSNCKGWSMTNSDGKWDWSMYLEPETYVLILDYPGKPQVKRELVVT